MALTEKSTLGWKRYIENEWTRFAEENQVSRSDQILRKIRLKSGSSLRTPIGGFRKIHLTEKRMVSKENPWLLWLDREYNFMMSVMEYKVKFENVRPWWAKTFYEQGYRKADMHPGREVRVDIADGIHIDIGEKSIMSIEREEKRELHGKRRIIIERLIVAGGSCRRVTRLFTGKLEESDCDLYVDTWTGKGRWEHFSKTGFQISRRGARLHLFKGEFPLKEYIDIITSGYDSLPGL
jgi:hypothetical protein